MRITYLPIRRIIKMLFNSKLNINTKLKYLYINTFYYWYLNIKGKCVYCQGTGYIDAGGVLGDIPCESCHETGRKNK